MIVLIEGVDRTGKTTLAEALLEAAKPETCAAWHFDKPLHRALREYVSPLVRNERGEDPFLGMDATDSVVLDRGHVGEAVWPEVFGREALMNWRERQWIELFMLSRGAVYVHAQRDLEDLEQAFIDATTRGEPEPLPVEQIGQAAAGFHVALEQAAPPVVQYDHRERETLIPRIAELARNAAEFARPGLELDRAWIGNPRPKLLAVGKTFQDGRGPYGLPAPDSDAFDQLMVEVGPDWRSVAIAHHRSHDLWTYLGRPATRTFDPRVRSGA